MRMPRLLAALSLSSLLIGSTLAIPAPAAAAGVDSLSALQSALWSCTPGTRVELGRDLAELDAPLQIGCDAVLDLSGRTVSLRNVVIRDGRHLTVDDTEGGGHLVADASAHYDLAGIRTTGARLTVRGGSLTAQGGTEAAGIGGNRRAAGGTVTIDGGSVIARGGSNAAGIGGGSLADGGTTTINGGDVQSTGGGAGAGIGSGAGERLDRHSGGTTTITGGRVVSSGGADGAGLGGGRYGDAGKVSLEGGTVVARGGSLAAGVGGGRNGSGGSVVVDGATVTATGGSIASGIGHGGSSDGTAEMPVDVVVNAGAVTATGGSAASGIGGANTTSTGDVVINGGTVIATGQSGAAGIGGGNVSWSPGLDVVIGSAATVTAQGGHTAIGPGASAPGAVSFGSLTVAGTLRVPAGNLRVDDSGAGDEVVVAPGGAITGTADSPTQGGTLLGYGQIANAGAITLQQVAAGTHVSGQHRRVTFDSRGGSAVLAGVTVLAPSFQAGHRPFPADPTRQDHSFAGWNTRVDGSGSTITATSLLPGASTDGAPHEITLYAQWEQAPTFSGSATASAEAGRRFTWTPDTLSGHPTPTVELTDGDLPDGLALDSTSGIISGRVAPDVAPGPRTIELTASNGVDPDAVHTLELTVEAGAVDTFDELTEALGGCTGTAETPATVTLAADLTDDPAAPATELVVDCHVRLDLDGHQLSVRNIVIETDQHLILDDSSTGRTGTLATNASLAPQTAGIRTTGATLTIDAGRLSTWGGDYAAGIGGDDGPGGTVVINGGNVTATGGFAAAGIGGSQGGRGGRTTINDGTVTAVNPLGASGIGGGRNADGGTTVINGGSVTATSHRFGSGIGGGDRGHGGTTTINGGRVAATRDSAGIGGGYDGDGGTVTIDAGAAVTAAGGHTAIGGGSSSAAFGSLRVAGTLTIPYGQLDVPDSATGAEVSVAPGGRITGGGVTPTLGALVTGAGRIDNAGAITLLTPLVQAEVFDQHHLVSFETRGGSPEPDDVTVFARTFEDGLRTFPADPTRDGSTFTGWNTRADGTGQTITASSTLPGSSDDGAPHPITLYAQWEQPPSFGGSATARFTAGESGAWAPETLTGDPAPTVTLTDGDLPDGLTLDEATGVLSGTVTATGTTAITLTASNGIDPDATHDLTIDVVPGELTDLTLTPSANAVDEGGTVSFAATGTDEHGNEIGDVTDDVTLTSDVATDVVTGSRITFPTASPHTITATHRTGVTDSVVIEVIPSDDGGTTPPPGGGPDEGEPEPTPPAERAPTAPERPAAALPSAGSTVGPFVLLTGLLALAAGIGVLGHRRRCR